MKTILKAAMFGAVLASAVFFLHFLIPVLLLLLFFGLIRRVLWRPRWHHTYASYGGGCGGPGRSGSAGFGAQRTPTVDGRDWQRPASADTQARDVQVN
jgi:drug/metabolite transporter (DMT)-like permease